MEYQNLQREIDAGNLAPVYFCFGEEDFLIHQLTKKIVERGIEPATKDFNFDTLQGEEVDGATIVATASSFPMMSDRRIVIVKAIQKLSTSDKKLLLGYVQDPLMSTCLILTAGKVDRRQSFYSSLSKHAHWVECKILYEDQAIDWVKQWFRMKGVTLSHEGANLLIQQVGTSLWHLYNEVEKLLTFSWGEKELGLEHVAAVVGFSRQFNTWEFTDAIGRKELKRGLILLERLLETGQSPVGIIVSLSRRINLLTRMRAMLDRGMVPNAIAKGLNLRPYFLKLYMDQAKHFSAEELESTVKALLQADLFIKTGYLEPNMALTLLIHHIVNGGTRKKLL